MIHAAALLMVFAAMAPTAAPAAPATLTFAEAIGIARGAAPDATGEDYAAALRGPRLPDVRLETTGNTSRTLDPFTSDPLQIAALSSVLAVDYPLLDGGVRRAQLAAIEARQRRSRAPRLDDERYNEVVEAFGDLYLAQRQEELLRPGNERISAEADRATRLLQAGEMANFEAASRRSQAAVAAKEWLDLESRREDASARLIEVLGLQSEPRLSLDGAEASPPAEGSVLRDPYLAATEQSLAENRARLRTLDAPARLTATLSGFAGMTSGRSEFNDVTSSGTFGIYGLRVHLSYPLFRSAQVAAAEARLAVEESTRQREEAATAAKKRADSLRRQVRTSERQLELLQQQLEQMRLTAASVQRLADAGLRPNADLVFVALDVARVEAEMLAMQVQRWKTVQRLRRLSAPEWPQEP
jgi:outer membrane protein TolC